MAVASRFWDRMAERYVAQPIADEDSYQRKLKVTRTYFGPEMEVLEFGAGSGSTALLHAPYVKHIHAIDFSQRMVEIARGKAKDKGVTNVSFEQADIETLAAADGRYDVILGLSILHLLKDKDAVIAKVYRMLKPGGAFVASTVCLGDTMAFFKLIAPVGKALGLLPQLDVMTRAQLRQALESAGFAVDHEWQPGKGKAVFTVAKKPA